MEASRPIARSTSKIAGELNVRPLRSDKRRNWSGGAKALKNPTKLTVTRQWRKPGPRFGRDGLAH